MELEQNFQETANWYSKCVKTLLFKAATTCNLNIDSYADYGFDL